jgi:hypothetical protein
MEHNKYSKEAFDREVAKLTAMNPDGPKNYEIYCTVIQILLETFLKHSRKLGKDNADIARILKDLKFQDECVEDLTKVLISNQKSLYENFQAMKSEKPLDKIHYRINISLAER